MRKKPHRYEGESILVTYDAQRCIHAAECVKGLPSVFDPQERPWVQPDKESADSVAEVVLRCPTGALQFERQDGGPAEEASANNSITVSADGPLLCHGVVDLEYGDSAEQEMRVALCRCGESENKPYCDNRHAKAGFQDAGQIVFPEASDEERTAGPLAVRSAPNGPLILEGSFSLVSATGEGQARNKAALCRCGASENKPFCDGTHKSVGFEAD